MLLILVLLGVVNALQTITHYGVSRLIEKSVYIKSRNECTYGVIMYPGAGKRGESYIGLCNKISERMNDSVSFLLLDLNSMSPFEVDRFSNRIGKYSVEYMKEQNSDLENIYFMGHSAGAYFAISPAERYGSGLIQLGSVLNSKGVLPWKKKSLKRYKRPVLTYLGGKDGYINYLNSVQEFESVGMDLVVDKPIIVDDDINHLMMGDNKETDIAKFLGKKDNPSELPLELAHDKISSRIAMFLNKDDRLIMDMVRSHKKISNYLALNDNINDICENIQRKVVNSKDGYEVKVDNEMYENKYDFIISKPEISKGVIRVNSFLKSMKCRGYLSSSLVIKMKTQESVMEDDAYRGMEVYDSWSAKDINREIFESIFIESCPVNIVFEEDRIYSNEIDSSLKWLKSDIEIDFDKKENVLRVRSPVLNTGNNKVAAFNGMLYMKLLTPQLAEEIKTLYL